MSWSTSPCGATEAVAVCTRHCGKPGKLPERLLPSNHHMRAAETAPLRGLRRSGPRRSSFEMFPQAVSLSKEGSFLRLPSMPKGGIQSLNYSGLREQKRPERPWRECAHPCMSVLVCVSMRAPPCMSVHPCVHVCVHAYVSTYACDPLFSVCLL